MTATCRAPTSCSGNFAAATCRSRRRCSPSGSPARWKRCASDNRPIDAAYFLGIPRHRTANDPANRRTRCVFCMAWLLLPVVTSKLGMTSNGGHTPMLRITKAAGLLIAALTITTGQTFTDKAFAAGTLRIGMTASDIPLTTGQTDQGGEGMRFMGYTVYDGLVNWDLSSSDKPSDLTPGL